jgi:hypothetical protein
VGQHFLERDALLLRTVPAIVDEDIHSRHGFAKPLPHRAIRLVADMDRDAFFLEGLAFRIYVDAVLAAAGLFDFNFHIPANALYFSFLAGVFFFIPAEDRA